MARDFDDNEFPLAHLITFRCYGTWLHGDDRGSVDTSHNHYKTPYALPNQGRHQHNLGTLKGEPVLLNADQRASVEAAIRETCTIRKWPLHALNASDQS